MIQLVTSLVLFSIGIYGVLSRKDLLRILISVSIMLGSITLLLVTLASGSASYALILFVWAVEVVEIIIALALFLSSKKHVEELKW